MQEKKKRQDTKGKTSFRQKERNVFKNTLTGPTLLEISGKQLAQVALRLKSASQKNFRISDSCEWDFNRQLNLRPIPCNSLFQECILSMPRPL